MASMQVSLTSASPCRHALNIQPSKELFICCRAPFRSLMSTFLRHTSPALPVPPPRPTHASSCLKLMHPPPTCVQVVATSYGGCACLSRGGHA